MNSIHKEIYSISVVLKLYYGESRKKMSEKVPWGWPYEKAGEKYCSTIAVPQFLPQPSSQSARESSEAK